MEDRYCTGSERCVADVRKRGVRSTAQMLHLQQNAEGKWLEDKDKIFIRFQLRTLNNDLDGNYFTEVTNVLQVYVTCNRLAIMGANRWI
jgi:hypothetical protein